MSTQSTVRSIKKYSATAVILLFSIGLFSYTTLEDVVYFLPNELNGLVTPPGLEVQLMAIEPMVKNPTNISIDERGRVWVTEAYNYRPAITRKASNPEGDRIIILEDSNGDGALDKSTLFYQGTDLNAPLGICVLDNKVIVSQSPYVWTFYDDNADGKADRKEIMFQGIGGEQHDHGIHAFTFGPDGKLYFNFGNSGITLKDKNNNVVLDQDGDEIGPKKYKQGMIFRCDPDGSHVEALADNFRNNYEVAVDSYGSLWQSDNDDDGNKSTRISYVMEYGRYGYVDELTGASWRANRTNIESEIPLQHWHQNDPGVVPNLLATGAGSPTGMAIYEGKLLPQVFQNQMIHAEAGTNVVRAYPVSNNGAGYTATISDILKGEKDQWFRPSDVCVAPDGSLIISDCMIPEWWSPGRRFDKGRIYRIVPTGQTKYNVQPNDYATVKGAVTALQNPNLTVRYRAWTALQKMGSKSIAELNKLWKSKTADPRMRARAFWALVKMSDKSSEYIQQAIHEDDANLRIVGIRAARELNADVIGVVTSLVNDPDAQVRRECAVALHHNTSDKASALWVTLALQYTGSDRWYLEALGIGADRQWDKFFVDYVAKVGDPLKNAASRDIVWRARTDKAIPYLTKLASDKMFPLNDRLRYFRAFDFNAGSLANSELLTMLENDGGNDASFSKVILRQLDPKIVESSVSAQAALKKVVTALYGTSDYLEIVNRYVLKSENPNLLLLAINKSNEPIGISAATSLLQLGGAPLVSDVINGNDEAKKNALLTALGGIGSVESLDILQRVAFTSSYHMTLRKQAIDMLGKSRNGKTRFQQLITDNKVPEDLLAELKDVSVKPIPQAITPASVTLQELLTLNANAKNGKAIFNKSCFICHQVNGEGMDFGPKLSEIGSKLPKESLLENIVHPSAESVSDMKPWELVMKDGSTMTGIVASKTSTDITLKYPGGASETIKVSNVKSMKELKNSMMPEGLQQTMSRQDLADLLEYLAGLKKS